MISKKTKYGLNALIALARAKRNEPFLIAELAEQERIPKKFLELILLDLKNHGILQSKKGKGGGYSLNRPASQITIGQIVRILDGPLAPVSCVSESAYKPCDDCMEESCCGIRLVMKDVRDAMANILDNTSLEKILQRIGEIQEKKGANYYI